MRNHHPISDSQNSGQRSGQDAEEGRGGSEGEGKVLTRTKPKQTIKRPRLYRVLLHNDDYTPREFVVLVLRHVFAKGEAESTAIMLHVHNNDVGVVGLYPFSVAETKIAEVSAMSEEANFPLMFTMEPDEEPSTDE